MPLDSTNTTSSFPVGAQVRLVRPVAFIPAGVTGKVVREARAGALLVAMDCITTNRVTEYPVGKEWILLTKDLELVPVVVPGPLPAKVVTLLREIDRLRSVKGAANLTMLRSRLGDLMYHVKEAGLLPPVIDPTKYVSACPKGFDTVASWLAHNRPDLIAKGGTIGTKLASIAARTNQVAFWCSSSPAEQAQGFERCRMYPTDWLRANIASAL